MAAVTRSPGEGKGFPLQYSGLENSMDCIVHGVAKSWTRLSNFHFHCSYHHSDFGAQENKFCHYFHCFPIYLPWRAGTGNHDLSFWTWSFKPAFSISSFTSSRGSLVLLHFLPLEWCHLLICGCWYFSQQSWFQFVLHSAWHFKWCTLHIRQISRMTIYSLDVLLSQFWISLMFHVQF